VIATDFDIWQQRDDMITDLFQPPGDVCMQHYYDDFRSCLEGFNTYSFEHLDLFYEEYFEPLLCSNFNEGKDMIGLKQDSCDEVSQPPSLPLSQYVPKDVSEKHVPSPSCLQDKVFS